MYILGEQWMCTCWESNGYVDIGRVMDVYILGEQCMCTYWESNGCVHIGRAMDVYILGEQWMCTYWESNPLHYFLILILEKEPVFSLLIVECIARVLLVPFL